MKKSKLKFELHKLIKESAFQELSKLKENHTKVKHIVHKKLEMQKYLQPSNIKIMQEEAQEIFKLG